MSFKTINIHCKISGIRDHAKDSDILYTFNHHQDFDHQDHHRTTRILTIFPPKRSMSGCNTKSTGHSEFSVKDEHGMGDELILVTY